MLLDLVCDMVSIDDFLKLEIKIVSVLSAERMVGSDKLLKLTVDLGGEIRQILSGIGMSYTPEEMIGKQLVALTNLETRKMMGEQSQGMILATGDDLEKISLLVPDKKVESGSNIR